MYLGSVRFFKHLIISTLILIVILISLFLFNVLQTTVFARAYDFGPAVDQVPAAAPAALSPAAIMPLGENEMAEPSQTTVPSALSPAPKVAQTPHAAPVQAQTPPTVAPDKPYQRLYPALYSKAPSLTAAEKGRVYLTFDDGPSHMTDDILDILKNNDIKATFFLSGKTDKFSKQLVKRIADEDHSIGIHTYTHDYKQVYGSVDAYLEDFNAMYNLIYDETGIKADLFRFPGGSVNGYNQDVYQELIDEMTRRGFTYYDWNVDAKDSFSKATVKSITQNVLHETAQHSRSIVLFHDGISKKTVSALDGIIKALKDDGYVFDKLTNTVKPIVFSLKK